MYIFGDFNFNATPLAPLGTKVVAHIDPDARAMWDLNGEVGWYVGPALNHYRCVEIFSPCTRVTRICDAVTFFPNGIPFPDIKLHDYLTHVAEDIIHLLTQLPSTTVPTLQVGDPV